MKKYLDTNRNGFTLIEVIVVAAIIAILAGILVPMIFNQIDESKITKAKGDIKSLENTLIAFRGDTKVWPTRSADSGACLEDVDMLRGPGTAPGYLAAAGALPFSGLNFSDLFSKAVGSSTGNCYTNFKGPYTLDVSMDPWEQSYILFTNGFKESVKGPAWVISAGPNKIIDTNVTGATVTAVAGDDIGKRIQ